MIKKIGLAALFLFFVTACSAPMKKFDAAKHPEVKTIAIVSVGEPEQYSLEDYGNVFGAIGAVINGVSKKDAFNALLHKYGYSFGARMQSALKKDLEAAGYKVLTVEAEREAPGAPLENFDQLSSTPADAYLDVACHLGGYASKNMLDSAYRPYLAVKTALVTGKGELMYSEHFAYGLDNPLWSLTEIPAPKQHYFADFNELQSNEKRAVEGLEEGTDTLSKTLADRLARR